MESSICRKFCSFYKPGKKEDMKCGTFAFLSRHLTAEEIRRAAVAASASPDFSEDRAIKDMVCSQCEFRDDGCDYRDGVGRTPCGGYAVVEFLLRRPGFTDTEH